ncbi:type I-E CRISPR-associated protein Cse1/CasA [Streptomyces sp. NPDC089919]|uniref:type I-E CRISPR-associated protein Cse1/CasA n=1 Tax=Streptomyces sp. NPDC089919 TaxID=3155188 RepID=UPI003447BC32
MGTYNLIDEPWIPVTWTVAAVDDRGRLPDRVGLRELFVESHLIAGLAVASPPAHSALLRILYALTLRVAGLDEAGPGDWGERRLVALDKGRLPAEKVAGYLEGYRDRFFLYDAEGGRPWMQDPRLRAECDPAKTAGVNKLIVTRPSGNNHAWFGRHGSDVSPHLPTASEAALNLLVWHYYGPSGRCSAREVAGVKGSNVTAGPLRTAMSYHPEGDTLFETLLAGLVRPPAVVRRADDLCPWEWDALPDPDAAQRPPSGPCSRLTACSQHALLLVPDPDTDGALVSDAFITWAYRSGRLPRADDYLIWQTSQQGNRYPRPADSRRALWRDLDALLLKEPAGSSQPQRPMVFLEAHEVGEDLRVRALGFEQDGQAKDTQFIDASTPPVLGFTEREAARAAPAIARARQLGEMFGWRLDKAVRRAFADYTRDAKANGDAWAAQAAARYWPQAADEFWHRFHLLDRSGTRDDAGFDAVAARRAFLRLAEEAFDTVTGPVTGTQRGAKAVFEARLDLYGRPRKTPSPRSGQQVPLEGADVS